VAGVTATPNAENAPHLVVAEGDARRGTRAEQPEPFLRGAAWPGTRKVAYPRVNPIDRMRVPGDTWMMASIPVGVRLEIVGDASAVDITYRASVADGGNLAQAASTSFEAWTAGNGRIDAVPGEVGEGKARVRLSGDPAVRTIVHLPEGMLPEVLGVDAVGGSIAPAPAQPRVIVYGDSIAAGSAATSPGLTWPARVGRELGIDHVNLGYSGSARGELASAEQVAKLDADAYVVCHGTNCWNRTPHSTAQMAANLDAFLDVLRQDGPDTSIVVLSPVVRPDAEAQPNRLGATLVNLRSVMEDVTESRIAKGETHLSLVRGGLLVGRDQIADTVHPNDDGYASIAAAMAPAIRAALAVSVPDGRG